MLGRPLGIADRDAQQEPVELILRQIIRAFKLKRVLRRDQHERPLERAASRSRR